MSRSLIAGLLLTPILVAAPVPKEDDAGRMRRIYGSVHDPDKGSTFKPDGDALHIGVPAEPRLIEPWLDFGQRDITNAPRVWRDVKGDFTATVRASFLIRAKIPTKHAGEIDTGAGGGLVVWIDHHNFLTVTRDERDFDGKPGEHFRCKSRIVGRGRTESEYSALNRSGYLRVQRKGKELDGSYSTDGKKWTLICSHEVEWADTLKVGVVAENNFNAPFAVAFDEYKLTTPKN